MQNNLPQFTKICADHERYEGLHIQNSILRRKRGTFRSMY